MAEIFREVAEMSKSQKALVKLRQDIYQSNPLMESCKKFSLLEHRVFYLGLRGVNPHLSDNDKFHDTEFHEIFIPNDQLKEMFGNSWYLSELKPLCEKLFDSKICFEDDRGGWELIHIFRKLKYIPAEGLYLQFDELMRPYILDLMEKSYTKIGWQPIFALSSPYAMRLLELMMQYQNIPGMDKIIKRSLTVEEIRFFLNVPADAYQSRQDNFRRFVLDMPIAEINRKTKYHMDYTVFKIGRKTSHFEFTLDTSRVTAKNSNNLLPPARSTSNAKKDITPFIDKPIEKKVLTESEMAAFLAGVEEEENDNNDDEVINPAFKHIRVIEEEEIEPVENTPENVKMASLLEMQNYDSELDTTQKTLNTMKKDAESCGLKLEDFHTGEIPIKAEYAKLLRDIYKNKPSLVELTLKEIYHMSLERFVELYKP